MWIPGVRGLSFRRRAIIILITEDIIANRRIMAADIMLSVRRVRLVARRRAVDVQNRWFALLCHGIRLVPSPVRQVVAVMGVVVVAVVADGGEICP